MKSTVHFIVLAVCLIPTFAIGEEMGIKKETRSIFKLVSPQDILSSTGAGNGDEQFMARQEHINRWIQQNLKAEVIKFFQATVAISSELTDPELRRAFQAIGKTDYEKVINDTSYYTRSIGEGSADDGTKSSFTNKKHKNATCLDAKKAGKTAVMEYDKESDFWLLCISAYDLAQSNASPNEIVAVGVHEHFHQFFGPDEMLPRMAEIYTLNHRMEMWEKMSFLNPVGSGTSFYGSVIKRCDVVDKNSEASCITIQDELKLNLEDRSCVRSIMPTNRYVTTDNTLQCTFSYVSVDPSGKTRLGVFVATQKFNQKKSKEDPILEILQGKQSEVRSPGYSDLPVSQLCNNERADIMHRVCK